MSVNTEAAVAFINEFGTDLERTCIVLTLGGTRPTTELVDTLFAAEQREDGSWAPEWAPDYGSLDATCDRLKVSEWLGVPNTAKALDSAVGFIMSKQREDGSWQEDDAIAGRAPEYLDPGNADATFYVTAYCAYWMMSLAQFAPSTRRAANYLQGVHDMDGHPGGAPLKAHWLSAASLHRFGDQERSAAIMSFLNRNINDSTASDILGAMCATLYVSGVATDQPVLLRALDMLEERQQEDGRWTSDESESNDPFVTFTAMRALKLGGRVNIE